MSVTLFNGERRMSRNVDLYKRKVQGLPVATQEWQLFIVRCSACFGLRRQSSDTWICWQYCENYA